MDSGHHAGLALLQTEIQKQLLLAEHAPFAVIDFDNTCIINDIQEATLAFVCKNHLLKDFSLLPNISKESADYHEQVFHHYYGLLNQGEMHAAYVFIATTFSGFTRDEVIRVVSDTIVAEGVIFGVAELYGIPIKKGLAPRAVVRELIHFLQDHAVDVWIVSASTDIAVQTAMDAFSIKGKLIGVRNKTHDGVLLQALEEPYSIMGGKVDCIKKYISDDIPPLLGVGDSVNDSPMINYARIRAIVNRNNALTREAETKNWFIL